MDMIPPSQTLVTRFRFASNNNNNMSCTLYWHADGPTGMGQPGALDDIAQDAFDGFQNVWEELADDDVDMLGCQAIWYPGDNLEIIGYSDGVSNSGDQLLEDALPDSSALIVRKFTRKIGRQHRGRIFIPGIGEGVQDNGYLVASVGNPSTITDAQALAAWVGSPLNSGDNQFLPRHWNRKDGGVNGVLEVIETALVVLKLAVKSVRMAKEFASVVHG
jgi:hypothetical protein